MELIISYWQAAGARGELPQPVHAVFAGDRLIYGSRNRHAAAKRAEDIEGSRLAKISPI